MSDLEQRVADLVIQEHFEDDDIRQLGPAAVPLLIDTVKTAAGPLRDRKCNIALHALGIFATDEAVEFLIATAENPALEGWLRRAAIRALGYASHPRALAYLESLLEDPTFSIRNSAVIALSRAAAQRSLQLLEHVQATDPDERIRQRAAQALSQTLEDQASKAHANPQIIRN